MALLPDPATSERSSINRHRSRTASKEFKRGQAHASPGVQGHTSLRGVESLGVGGFQRVQRGGAAWRSRAARVV